MMATDALIAASALAAVLGVGTLRFAWSRAKRSSVLNTLGWGLLAASVAGGWAGAGAWGSTVSALWAMGAAFVLLAVAALTAPAARSPASNRRAGMLPEGNEPRRTGRRLITFLLVAVLPLVPSVGAALALVQLGKALGWSTANALVTALMAAPLVWALITYAVLMRADRQGQLKILALASLPLLPALAAGIAA
ncbi:hypothetical protein [Novosphingobium panipatense]|uniref:Uncharacterized protein n=2 Tax=Novosphingobium panipatense TaxID=428991 RepID=A0ABY1QLC1_9SPHN|nr:hypothetical protein [Novosphingobium panipatense]SMP74738.1 hypothetical protein SAMN06296065_107153 [Novosphingobium panipatense]